MGTTNADTLNRIRHEDYAQIVPEVVQAITTAMQMDDLSNFVPKIEQAVSKAVLVAPSHKMTHKQQQDEQ